ncbi:MAG: hypothetical protein ABL908_18650 [Hyphomicrobium sp.]
MNNQAKFDDAMRVQFERDLTLVANNGNVLRAVKLLLYETYSMGEDWLTWYEIRDLQHPGSIYRFYGVQVDPLGAFITAIHQLALKLVTSDAYMSGQLYWFEPRDRCGLPLPKGYDDL